MRTSSARSPGIHRAPAARRCSSSSRSPDPPRFGLRVCSRPISRSQARAAWRSRARAPGRDVLAGRPITAEVFRIRSRSTLPQVETFHDDPSPTTWATRPRDQIMRSRGGSLWTPTTAPSCDPPDVRADRRRSPLAVDPGADGRAAELSSAAAVAAAPGVSVIDDPADGLCRWRSMPPTPTTCSSGASIVFRATTRALSLWVVGDNLRKGAALNAVQIASYCTARRDPRGAPAAA